MIMIKHITLVMLIAALMGVTFYIADKLLKAKKRQDFSFARFLQLNGLSFGLSIISTFSLLLMQGDMQRLFGFMTQAVGVEVLSGTGTMLSFWLGWGNTSILRSVIRFMSRIWHSIRQWFITKLSVLKP